MIEDYIASMVQESIMNELGPYILIGFITLVCFIGYHVCARVDSVVEKRRR